MKKIQTGLFLVLITTFFGCLKGYYYDQNVDIKEGIWSKKDTAYFDVNMADTVGLYDVYVNLRNDANYPYQNIFLYIKTRFPNGAVKSDTIAYQMENENGQWNGSGFGSVWNHEIEFRKQYAFPLKGKYQFQIIQGTRTDSEVLTGILDVGLTIKQAITK